MNFLAVFISNDRSLCGTGIGTQDNTILVNNTDNCCTRLGKFGQFCSLICKRCVSEINNRIKIENCPDLRLWLTTK